DNVILPREHVGHIVSAAAAEEIIEPGGIVIRQDDELATSWNHLVVAAEQLGGAEPGTVDQNILLHRTPVFIRREGFLTKPNACGFQVEYKARQENRRIDKEGRIFLAALVEPREGQRALLRGRHDVARRANVEAGAAFAQRIIGAACDAV